MRTNIEIDDAVVQELMKLTGRKTKRQVIDDALRDQLRRKRAAKALLELEGSIEWTDEADLPRQLR
ncbi:type II toxin-antitoxin system VapB family antitoxin [uncultured Hoeflea sp.]|uniref:type II toxin-antitoxin system VapB family antitoxin n=1 Tax=uncultured Hoeflea sp. TaxID=538666 RepID=UPI00260C7482|nr:type II toxin-antitoxin system VapB family antitoxin [uncultured Hoeflea sp.]